MSLVKSRNRFQKSYQAIVASMDFVLDADSVTLDTLVKLFKRIFDRPSIRILRKLVLHDQSRLQKLLELSIFKVKRFIRVGGGSESGELLSWLRKGCRYIRTVPETPSRFVEFVDDVQHEIRSIERTNVISPFHVLKPQSTTHSSSSFSKSHNTTTTTINSSTTSEEKKVIKPKQPTFSLFSSQTICSMDDIRLISTKAQEIESSRELEQVSFYLTGANLRQEQVLEYLTTYFGPVSLFKKIDTNMMFIRLFCKISPCLDPIHLIDAGYCVASLYPTWHNNQGKGVVRE